MADASKPIVSFNTQTYVLGLGFAELIMIGFVGYFLSKLVGTTDTGNDLVKTVIPVTGSLGGIVFLHTILWYLYSRDHESHMNIYFLLATSVSLCISLMALSIAIVNRS